GRLLADRDVHADEARAVLVDDRVDGDGGLAGAAVADDELPLAAPDRDHAVDGLHAGLEGLLHRLAVGDARSGALDRPELLRLDGPLAVQPGAQWVHHTADPGVPHRH